MPSVGTRAGRYVKQRTGYSAFIPAALPPAPPVLEVRQMSSGMRGAAADP